MQEAETRLLLVPFSTRSFAWACGDADGAPPSPLPLRRLVECSVWPAETGLVVFISQIGN